ASAESPPTAVTAMQASSALRARQEVLLPGRMSERMSLDRIIVIRPGHGVFGVCADADQQQCSCREETADLLAHTRHTRAVLLVLICCGSSARSALLEKNASEASRQAAQASVLTPMVIVD
ncbi:MAG TPA: hypothetical protein VK554_13625, partial [Bradyrhizobium sp.]|nr:hypothetical protein [Bradyrhizobium sp.]